MVNIAEKSVREPAYWSIEITQTKTQKQKVQRKQENTPELDNCVVSSILM
jgi:hypothetical protein